MNKKVKKILNPNINIHNKLINNSFLTQDEEIKSIQRSIALLRQDIRKIVREEVEGAFQRN
jgi:hypothetical protein